MASAGNSNQSTGPPFDMHHLFNPVSPQNSSNFTTATASSPSPLPLPLPSSYPTPTSSSSYPPPSGPFPFHPHYIPYPPQDHQHQLSNMHSQRPISYPTPPPHLSTPHNPNSGTRLMALLGTQNQSPSNLDLPPHPIMTFPSSASDFSTASNTPPPIPSTAHVNLVSPHHAPARLLSSKLPKGRHLIGDHVVYDINVSLQGEVQPQLEVTPITKYTSDPGLFVGRQIAVNRTYICYGLKLGNIRVLNINTAVRSLLRGHTQRVSDMAFFAEDVHFLASVSVDKRVFIWKIDEGPDVEDKPQITGKIVMAIQIIGEGDVAHPRVCWHCHKQEILVVGIGNRILKIDTTKVGKREGFSAEEPLRCPIDRLIDGVQYVGKHDGEITELSMCQWMTTRLASASRDGTVKIWEDRKTLPIAILKPHNGNPVNSVTFLTAPHRPDHIVLITGGPLNQELKIWASASEEGWLLPSDVDSWHCTQTLEMKSSAESNIKDAFFNQVVALPHAGLFLLANAKKNAIYAVHIEYGPTPAAARLDYIAEFTVTMPILSVTGTSDSLPDGEHVVQVYCVQTQAIQQYALNLSQCLPPPLESMDLEKTDSTASRAFDDANTDGSTTLEHGSKPTEKPVGSATPKPLTLSSSTEGVSMTNRLTKLDSSEASNLLEVATSYIEPKPDASPSSSNAEDSRTLSPPLPLSPKLSRKLSGFTSPSNNLESSLPLTDDGGEKPVRDYSVDRRMETVKENLANVTSSGDKLMKDEKRVPQNDIPMVPNPPVMFKHPTHLVTPSEILARTASSSSQGVNLGEANIHDLAGNNDFERNEVEVKVVGETGIAQNDEFDLQRETNINVARKREKIFCSQASDLSIKMARDCRMDTYNVEGAQQVNSFSVPEALERPPYSGEEEVQDLTTAKVGETANSMTGSHSASPSAKGNKHKGKTSQLAGPSPPSSSPFNSTDSSNDPRSTSSAPLTDGAMSLLRAMQERMDQLMSMQKEMQKQMNVMVAVPVTKEGRRLEASLGRSMEKVVKANNDASWARLQEENVKHEKLERDRMQQMTNLITNCMNKDLPTMLERTLKKEIAAVGPSVVRSITPNFEKAISSAVSESFQKGVGDKAVNQLEKAVNLKLEATVARQIQTQFQTSGKQALQDALRSSLEASVIPSFEMSCKSMFEQVDATFQRGLSKHTTAAQQQFESTHSPLAVSLRDAINSASSLTHTLSGELADGQRKLLAIAAAGANSNAANPLVTQLSNGPLAGLHEMAEANLDPTKELSRLIAERKYDEAFTGALHRSDVALVSWLCSQVDLQGILSMTPFPLSQGVLLALLQQLACDISNETPRKLAWMTDVAVAINPGDPMIAMHVRPIFDQVYQILGHQQSMPTTSAAEASTIRILMHVINSVLMSCK